MQMFRVNIVINLLFSFCCSGIQSIALESATAATYYVSPLGSDSSSGTSSAPFRSIQKAANIVTPGDTVIVKDGIYADIGVNGRMVIINRGGTSSNWITFKAENKWGAKLSGNNNAARVGVFFDVNARYIRWEDFEIYGTASNGISTNANSNKKATAWAHHIYIYGNKIHDIARTTDNTDYGNSGISTDAFVNDVTIDSCIFYNIGRLNPNTTPSATERSCTVPATGKVACYNHDHGIYLRGVDHTIINNVFYPEFKSGWPIAMGKHTIHTNGTVKIINNTFYGGNPERDGVYTTGSGVIMDQLIVQNNIAHSPRNYCYPYSATDNDDIGSVTIANNLCYGASLIDKSGCSKPGWTCSNNITGLDPKFKSVAARDFHLQAQSPSRRRGDAKVAPMKDHANKKRPQDDRCDIGAYEYDPGL